MHSNILSLVGTDLICWWQNRYIGDCKIMLVHILSPKSPITGPSSPTWCNTPKWSPTQFKASNRVVLLRVQGNELRLVYVIWMPFNWPKLLRNPFHKKANDHYLSYIRITQSARHGAPVIKACSYEDEAKQGISQNVWGSCFIWKEPWSMSFLATHHFLGQLFVSVDSGWSLL